MNKYGMVFGSAPMIIGICVALLAIIGFFVIQALKKRKLKGQDQDTFKPAKVSIDPNKASSASGDDLNELNDLQLPAKKQSKVGKYAAQIFTINDGIIYSTIDKPKGKPVYLDPSVPGHHGAHYLLKEIKEGEYVEYDPRAHNFDADETPSRCYKATHVYDLIRALFANKYGLLDKINYLIMALLIICSFFIILTLIDKVGK